MTAGALTPPNAAAQALCAAPHSAPSLRPSGSVETIEPLTGWLQTTLLRQRSSQFFDTQGDELPILGEGEVTSNSVFLTTAFGITEGLEMWAQGSILNIQTVSGSGTDSRSGVGDFRLAARFGSELFRVRKLPLMVRAGIKLPGTELPIDATLIPLGEGQIDYELGLETGYYYAGRFPLQFIAAGGYRWRTLNEDNGRKPGDERYLFVGIGGPRPGWRWGLAFEGLWGDPPVQDGLTLVANARQLLQIDPSVAFQVKGSEMEFAARIPISGQNLVSGTIFTFGVFVPWALP